MPVPPRRWRRQPRTRRCCRCAAGPGERDTPPSMPEPGRVGEQVAEGRALGPAGWSSSTLPSSTATSTASAVSSLVTDASAKRPVLVAVAWRRCRRRPDRRRPPRAGPASRRCRRGRPGSGAVPDHAGRPGRTRRRAEHDVGRVALVDVADEPHVDAVAAQLAQPGLEGPCRGRRGCRAAGSPAGGCSRRSSSWRCRCGGRRSGWRRRRARGSRATRARCPAAISAGTDSNSAPYSGEWSARCEPGMIRVAPFASVKSVRAHIVLQTVGGCGFGIGMSWSSAWIGCAVSPGSMAIDDSDEMRQPRSSTPSTTGSTRSWTGTRSNTRSWASRL